MTTRMHFNAFRDLAHAEIISWKQEECIPMHQRIQTTLKHIKSNASNWIDNSDEGLEAVQHYKSKKKVEHLVFRSKSFPCRHQTFSSPIGVYKQKPLFWKSFDLEVKSCPWLPLLPKINWRVCWAKNQKSRWFIVEAMPRRIQQALDWHKKMCD